MLNPGNVDFLKGRHYASRSGNVCRFEKLADGALRANWTKAPTESDIEELNAWAVALFESEGDKIRLTTHVRKSAEDEREALERWRKLR